MKIECTNKKDRIKKSLEDISNLLKNMLTKNHTASRLSLLISSILILFKCPFCRFICPLTIF